MAGIKIPGDRTVQQQPRGYCRNPQCLEDSDAGRFEFPVDHDRFACPKCGGQDPPMVGLLVLTHLLLPDQRGPIRGQMGRWKIACTTQRAYLATLTNLEAATTNPEIANCPGCLQAAEQAGVFQANGQQLLATA